MRRLIVNIFGWFRNFFCNIFCKRKARQDYYFVAGEVVFQVQHPDFDSPEDARQNVVNAIVGFLAAESGPAAQQRKQLTEQQQTEYEPIPEGNWRGRLQPPDDNTPVITFRNDELGAFSIAPIRIVGHNEQDAAPDSVLDVLEDAYAELRPLLEENRVSLMDGINLLSISPNWISGGLHHGPATGGPGSLPTDLSSISSGFEFVQDSLRSLSTFIANLSGEKHVAILDTLPPDTLIEQALSSIPTQSLRVTAGDLLVQYLFDNSASQHLDVIPYDANHDQAEIDRLSMYTPVPEHYPMPNHGTFIAGIVRTIAPNAEIHLRQVLNEYGCGSFITVAQGLQDALAEQQRLGYALIINCSFRLNLKLGTLNQRMRLLSDPATSEFVERSMRDVFDSATATPNVIVVAAAGNDSSAGSRETARYPAAFRKVLGVGALPKAYPRYAPGSRYAGLYIHALYSNLSYSAEDSRDRTESFMTFGGEVDRATELAVEGVAGVYFDEFPRLISSGAYRMEPVSSPDGWAHWSGTSFSAPIITGILAANSLTYYTDPTTPAPYFTRQGENVIIAKQV